MTKWGNVQPSLDNSEHVGPDTTGDNIHAKKVVLYTWNGSEWERLGGSTGGGISSAEPVLKKLIDDTTTANVTYIGEAALGTATSASSWKIKRIDETVAGLVTITWTGTGFDAVWDNRATTETYS